MYCGMHVYEKLAGMSAWLLGFIALRELLLPEQVAHLLAQALGHAHLEGRIGLGGGVRQVAEVMGPTKLMRRVGQDLGHCRDQALLLVAEHGENRPLQVLERFQKGCERGLILLAEPTTA